MTALPSQDRRPLATPDELAAYLGVPKATIYRWSSRREGVPMLRIGRHLRARWADVDAWIEQQMNEGRAA